MAITLVQHTSVDDGTTQSPGTALAYGSNVTAGSLLIAVVRVGGSSSFYTPVVSDNNTNSWQSAIAVDDTVGGNWYAIWYAMNAHSGATSVTVSWSAGGTAVTLRYCIAEYSGAATSSALDQTAGTIGTGTSGASGSVTPLANNELIVCLEGANGTGFTQTAGQTEREQQPTGANLQKIIMADVVQTTATAINNTFTLGTSQNWGAAIATFKAPLTFLADTATVVGQGSVPGALTGVANASTVTQAVRRGGYF